MREAHILFQDATEVHKIFRDLRLAQVNDTKEEFCCKCSFIFKTSIYLKGAQHIYEQYAGQQPYCQWTITSAIPPKEYKYLNEKSPSITVHWGTIEGL